MMTAKMRISTPLVLLTFLCLLMGTTGGVYAKEDGASKAAISGASKAAISVASTAFKDGGMIPRDYSCDGRDVSPPLSWAGVPEGAKSLALLCEDPDAPAGIWVHWVMFNIPATANGLPMGVHPDKTLKDGAKQGINSFNKIGYGGPCPPRGTHRYYFRIYALDIELSRKPGLTRSQLQKAMKGHILGQGQLMGRYKR